MERYDEALAGLNRAIELGPGNALAIVNRGEVYLAMDRDEDALADFTRAIELEPGFSDAIDSLRSGGYRGLSCWCAGLR